MAETGVAPSSSDAVRADAVSIEKTSVLDSLTPHLFRALRREPAMVITSGYLLVAMAGIFYNYTFYRSFGIPVLTLSQAGDFLVAGIQQPMAILLVLSTLPLVWLVDRFNLNRRRRRVAQREALLASGRDSAWIRIRIRTLRSPPRWLTALVLVCIVFFYGWVFVQTYARYRAESVERGEAPMVTVWLNGAATALPSKSAGWTYLGAVANYIFVYDHDAQRAEILPVNNVSRVEPADGTAKNAQPSVFVAPFP